MAQRLNETGKVFDGIQPGVIAQVVATTLAAEPQSALPVSRRRSNNANSGR